MKRFLPVLVLLFAGGVALGAWTARKEPPPAARPAPDFVEELRAAPRTYHDHVVRLMAEHVRATPGAEQWLLEQTREPHDAEIQAALLESLWVYYRETADPAVIDEMLAALNDPTRKLGAAMFLASIPGALEDLSPLVALTRDPDLRVRSVALNGLVQQSGGTEGRHEVTMRALVDVAVDAIDPGVASRALQSVNLRHAGADAPARVLALAASAEPAVRLGAAAALGTAGPTVLPSLEEWYRAETDVPVRMAIVESIVRSGVQRSLPVLERLRGLSAEGDREIEAYAALLREGIREWRLIQRCRRVKSSG